MSLARKVKLGSVKKKLNKNTLSPEAEKLTGLTAHQLENPLETLQQQPLEGLRLIPYHAVGKEGGLLLGMRIREVTVDGKTAPAVVAFAPNRLGDTNYAALVGGNV